MIKFHLLTTTLALVIMCLAGIQALLVTLQDKFIRQSYMPQFINYFPPLETMEVFLFRLILVGFALLSTVLITSIIFFHPIFAPPLRQKSLLTIFAWGVLAILLFGRYAWGWRGRIAIRWTLAGASLLLIIYCSTFLNIQY